ncbi:MAG: transglutaminase domain-containing protein [bacterium]|nr:transglutaminase domain-containing protein [bacterium]
MQLSSEASQALDIPEHEECSRLDEIIQYAGPDPGALRMWVAKNINYTGADAGVWPGWSPRSPEQTLEDGSGVCRDRAILLTWLLRKAGYEAYPALASTQGKTSPLVDARSFNHMITVYRNSSYTDWIVLDPTPKGIPQNAGASFGLRGCTYLPMIPGGSELQTIPLNGWNDTITISLAGVLNLEAMEINGTLLAQSNGVPLELITTIYTQSAPSMRNEMFRRFFGALRCDSVSFDGELVAITGSWQVFGDESYLLLPGLREISLHGTRIASMLLPCPPDSFVLDAPATEILNVSLDFTGAMPTFDILLPEPISATGYFCEMLTEGSRLVYSENADIVNSNPNVIETLLLRNGTSPRIVVFQ